MVVKDGTMANKSDFAEYKVSRVADLIPYIGNARTHSEDQIKQIASSIKEFGFLSPIVTDGENGILAGHGRVLAAQLLGLKSVPTVEASHLSKAQRRAFILADNKLALNAGWDFDQLRDEIQFLQDESFDISVVGFSQKEVDAFSTEFPSESSTDEIDTSFVFAHKCPRCGFEFDDDK